MNVETPKAAIESLATVFPALQRLGAHLRRKEIPFIEQTMATDCGAASLAMALGLHGHHVELEEVRQVLQVTRDGVSARAIVEAAGRFELDARGVKVALADLVHLPRGSILHWDFSHFVVFDRVEGDVVHIVDPAMGPRKILPDEASKSITGVAIALEPRESFTKKKKAESVVVRYLRSALKGSQDWGRIAMVSLTIEGLTLLLPLITGRLVDRVLPRNDVHLLYVLVAAFVVSGVFFLIASLVRGHLLLHLKTRFDTRMTMSFVRHVLRLPYDFFELRQPADLQMRVSSIQSIRETLTGAVLSGALDGTLVLSHLLFLSMMSVRMLGIAVLVVAVEGGLYVLTRKRLRELSSDVLAKQTTASNALQELLNGIESLKAGGVEQRAAQTWANNYVDVLNVNLRRGATQATSEAVLNTLKIAGPVLLLVIGIVDVMEKRMSIGTMLSANAMAVGFIMPTMSLINTLQSLQQARAQLMRIEDVVNTEQEQSGQRMMAPPLSGQISLERVSFRYGPKLPLALRDVSLAIKPGEMVALVGRSGSGKSTLGRMLAGLYQPNEGAVRLDGMPLSQLDLQSVRQQLGVVVQRAHVFGTTVRANIALGEPGIPLQQVMDAAKIACIHEDIAKLPMGYDTPIIAGGSSLSGGQRQRIALARALVNKPAILLLDEATSALDAVTEHQVTQNLDQLRCTRIVIAHRLSTVVNADRIIVMEQGELVEQGTHAELLAKGGFYAKLVESQLGPMPAPVAAAPVAPAPAPVVTAAAPTAAVRRSAPPPVPERRVEARPSAPPPVPTHRPAPQAVPANVMSFDEVRARRQRREADPLAKAVGAGMYAPFAQAWDDAEAEAQGAYYAHDPGAPADHGYDPRYDQGYGHADAHEVAGNPGYAAEAQYVQYREERDASELPTEMNYRPTPEDSRRPRRR